MDDKRIDSFSPRGRTGLFSAGGKWCCDIIPLCTEHAVLTAEEEASPARKKPTNSTYGQRSTFSWGAGPRDTGQGGHAGLACGLSTATLRMINKHFITIYMQGPNFN